MWRFQRGASVSASALTYRIDGDQYPALYAGGSSIPYRDAPRGDNLRISKVGGTVPPAAAPIQRRFAGQFRQCGGSRRGCPRPTLHSTFRPTMAPKLVALERQSCRDLRLLGRKPLTNTSTDRECLGIHTIYFASPKIRDWSAPPMQGGSHFL